MNGRRHTVQFVNPQGLQLVGIVHEPPPERRSRVGVILLSPGVKNRVAPHRLYVKMAERLLRRGLWVLRFDFYGLGDSEGRIGEPLLADLYGSVGTGRYVEDTWTAIDFLRKTYPVDSVIIGGLCGGAITGILAAPSRREIAGIIGLGLPVMLEGRRIDKHQSITAGQLKRLRANYLRKVFDPRSWIRLLTLNSDWRLLVRALRGRRPPAAVAPGAAPVAGDNTNQLFPPAFFEVLGRGCPVLLLFSETDRLWFEFEEKFLVHHRPSVDRFGALLDVAVVPGANHIFTLDVWQADMLDRVDAWLDRRFPSLPASPATSGERPAVGAPAR